MKAQSASASSRNHRWTLGFSILVALLLAFWPGRSARAQSNTTSTASSQSSSQEQSQKSSQSATSSSTRAQAGSAAETDPLAEAARKASAAKKSRPKHVYTDDDLSSIRGGISVVGDGSSDGDSAGTADSGEGARGNNSSSSGGGTGQDEAYWRGKAQAIKDRIASVDQQIARVKAEIAKSGPAAMDPVTGLTQNTIIIHDRNAEVQQLQDRKAGLEHQLDELADQGRRAGADPGWFR
jgi:septal ring factor EnvC (AmiA/AmiB activator)